MAEFRLETERLTLRDWREADIAPFHAICTDPEVMATLGPPLSHAETVALVARMKAHQNEHGHCFWALERREDAGLIGWCGVIRGTAGPVAGMAEIGWRLARNCWGRGYASEAARASIGWAFENLADPAVWAITASRNGRSQAVMERLGMVRHPELDFDHPKVPDGSALKPHVTYSIARPA